MIRVDSGLNRLRASAAWDTTPLEALLEPLLLWFEERPWIQDALCAQTDPDSFFPEVGESTAAAKRVCAQCPVLAQCQADTLSRTEPFGVWGGMAVGEREDVRRGHPLGVAA